MKRISAKVLLGMAAVVFGSVSAEEFTGGIRSAGHEECCCDGCHPAAECCESVCCEMELTTKSVPGHRYDVRCETICIPPVTLPQICPDWLPGGDRRRKNASPCPGCGEQACQVHDGRFGSHTGLLSRLCACLTNCRVRTVKRLKRIDHTTEKCVCRWTVRKRMVRCGADGCCGDECGVPAAECGAGSAVPERPQAVLSADCPDSEDAYLPRERAGEAAPSPHPQTPVSSVPRTESARTIQRFPLLR